MLEFLLATIAQFPAYFVATIADWESSINANQLNFW